MREFISGACVGLFLVGCLWFLNWKWQQVITAPDTYKQQAASLRNEVAIHRQEAQTEHLRAESSVRAADSLHNIAPRIKIIHYETITAHYNLPADSTYLLFIANFGK